MMHLTNFFNGQELSKLNSWKEEQFKKCQEKQNLDSPDLLNTGAIGGLYTYSFTPTTIGIVIKITNNITGDILDLSDYDSW